MHYKKTSIQWTLPEQLHLLDQQALQEQHLVPALEQNSPNNLQVSAREAASAGDFNKIKYTMDPGITIYWKLMKTILIGTKNSLIRT